MGIKSILLKILNSKLVGKSLLALVDVLYALKGNWPIWRDYMFTKLPALTIVGLLLAFFTWQKAPYTSKEILAAIVLSCSAGAVFAGYVHFKIDDHRVRKRTLAAFNSPPLSQFLENGFDNRFVEQLWGKVNNYDIIITPLHGRFGQILTIRIPVSTDKSVDEANLPLTPYFNLVLQNYFWFARADIENYLGKFNYFELMNMITQATEKVQLLDMHPYKFVE
jgi:hypothetical protein